MLQVTQNNEKRSVCIGCSQPSDGYRSLYDLNIGDRQPVTLCTECMQGLIQKFLNVSVNDTPNSQTTDYDLEIETRLRLLLNRKISGTWNGDCEKMFSELNQKKMSNSFRMLHRQIENW